MFRNYVKIALRNILRNKGYSLINITGLAIGMVCCILLLLYVQFELSYDRFHTNADRIYRVIREGKAFTPSPLGPKLAEDLPEVQASVRLIKSDNILISNQNTKFFESNFYWADPDIFEVFTLPVINGNPNNPLNDPFSVFISEKIANKYFRNENPLGKILSTGGGTEFTISGVFSDLPENSHLSIDFIAGYKTYFRLTGNDINNWFRNFTYTYILLEEGIETDELENKFRTVVDQNIFENLPPEVLETVEKPYPRIFFPQQVLSIHLHSHLLQEISANNNIKKIYLFIFISLIILVLACINYINLTTAQASKRGKEIGIRKIAGAQKKQIFYQFISESIIITIITMLISLVILELILPTYSNLINKQLQFNPINNNYFFLILLLFTGIVGLFAGSYPAVQIAGFKPVLVLKGSFIRSSKGTLLRNILIIIQFSIAIVLLICIFVIRNQLTFVKNVEVGYNKDNVIVLPVRDRKLYKNIEAIKSELKENSDILEVSVSDQLPNDISTFTSADWPDRGSETQFTVNYNTSDQHFVDLYNIEIVEGRNFSKELSSAESGEFLLNQAAVKAAQMEEPIGMEFSHWNGETGKIVGIMKDFNLHSLHNSIKPLYIYLDPFEFSTISIRIDSSDIPATIKTIKTVFNNFSSDYPFEYSFFDEVFDSAYHSEQKMVTIVTLFAVLAIIISCLGLFGLTSYLTERRTNEIGIRKVMGSSVSKLVYQLSIDFIKWVLLANIIAFPIAWYLMNKWLQNYAYHTLLNPLLFVLAGSLAIIIAIVTVSFQTVKAANTNPAKSLKYE